MLFYFTQIEVACVLFINPTSTEPTTTRVDSNKIEFIYGSK